MKKIFLILTLIFGVMGLGGLASQTPYDTVNVYDPQNFTEMTTIDPANGQIISRKNNLNRRINFDTLRNYVTPSVTHAWLGDPLDSVNVLSSYWRQFVTDSLGRVWYVDADGDAKMLHDPTGGSVGSASAGYLTYWNTSTTITNTDVAYTSTLIDADALTGAFGFPVGTTAQRPLVSTGRTRFNSDLGDLEFYNGSAWRSLPESSANAFTAGQFIIANPAGILTDTTTAGALSMLGGVSGTGTANQVAYWSGTSALTGHANFLWDGSQLSVGGTSSDYTLDVGTGGMRLAPQSAAPTGAEGVLYWDSDAPKGLLIYNGTRFGYVPESTLPAFTATRVPFADANGQLAQDGGLVYDASNDHLTVAQDVYANIFKVNSFTAGNGIWLGAGSTISMLATGTGGNTSKIEINLHNTGNEGWLTVQESGGTDAARIGLVDGSRGVYAHNFCGFTSNTTTTFRSANSASSSAAGATVYGSGAGINEHNGGHTYLRGGGIQSSNVSTGSDPGNVYIQTYRDPDSLTHVATIRTHMIFSSNYGGRATTQIVNRLATTTGTQVLTMEGDTLKYRVENFGAISTTTDGSGDVTVTHGMGTTPTAVLVTPTGTTAWIVSVHTIGATTFKVRFYDAAGAAVTTTAVTATWLGKT